MNICQAVFGFLRRLQAPAPVVTPVPTQAPVATQAPSTELMAEEQELLARWRRAIAEEDGAWIHSLYTDHTQATRLKLMGQMTRGEIDKSCGVYDAYVNLVGVRT